LILHFERGYVFSTPEVFAMGRPVRRAAPAAEIFNPEVNWPAGECDCWHLYLIAGSPAAAVRLMPYRLPWLSVERGGGLVFFPLKRVVDFFTER
jgi:hypothetical protein